MPSYEVRQSDDGFEWVRLSDTGKVTKRQAGITMFEAAVADANRQEHKPPKIDPGILKGRK